MKTTKIPTLETLIKKWKFDHISSDITDDQFSQPTKLGTDYKLYLFDRYISSEDAIKEMENEGYRPANIYELLLWKEWNEKDWVVALGSVGLVSGGRGVPCLDEVGSKRCLGLYWWDGDWNGYYRFLAVRNSSSETKVFGDELGNLENLTLRVQTLEEQMKKLRKFLII